MFKFGLVGVLAGLTDAQTYMRGADRIPNRVPEAQSLNNKKCYGKLEVIKDGEEKRVGIVYFKMRGEPYPWGNGWMAQASHKFKGNLDVFQWTELQNTAVVENWRWANCYEKDYYTQKVATTPTFQTFERTVVDTWKNDPDHSDYEWSLNKFLVNNGIQVKANQAVNMDVPEGYGKEEKPLSVKFIEPGKGDILKDGDTIYIHYRGTLDNGELFDFSRDTNRTEKWKNLSQLDVPPMKIIVGETPLVEGFTQALRQLRPDSHAEVVIPPSLGYKGKTIKKIPAYSYLHFAIEVFDVFPKGEVDTRAEAERLEAEKKEEETEQ